MTKKAKVIGFSSFKGGVGKSTTVLLAAHHLHEQHKRVVVIDADMVGTELATIAGLTVLRPSLWDILYHVPLAGRTPLSVSPWIRKEVVAPLKGQSEIHLIRSYPTGWKWSRKDKCRQVIEQANVMVSDHLRQLFRYLIDDDKDRFVLVDLPPFHVGFAEQVERAIKEIAKDLEGIVYHVVGPDFRDLLSLFEFSRDTGTKSNLGPIIMNGFEPSKGDVSQPGLQKAWTDRVRRETKILTDIGIAPANMPTPTYFIPHSNELAFLQRSLGKERLLSAAPSNVYLDSTLKSAGNALADDIQRRVGASP